MSLFTEIFSAVAGEVLNKGEGAWAGEVRPGAWSFALQRAATKEIQAAILLPHSYAIVYILRMGHKEIHPMKDIVFALECMALLYLIGLCLYMLTV